MPCSGPAGRGWGGATRDASDNQAKTHLARGRRRRGSNPPPIQSEPSSYFYRQVHATFFNEAVGGHSFAWWGTDNCMWSNDYPHPNSTWPHSCDVIERDLGHLPSEARAKLVRENVKRLYSMRVPQPA